MMRNTVAEHCERSNGNGANAVFRYVLRRDFPDQHLLLKNGHCPRFPISTGMMLMIARDMNNQATLV